MNDDDQTVLLVRGALQTLYPEPTSVDLTSTMTLDRRRSNWTRLGLGVACVVVVVILTVVLTQLAPNRKHALPAGSETGSVTARIGSQVVHFQGVRVTVASSWPVIDGGHVRYTCTSVFVGQSDRVFLGPSYQFAPSCGMSRGPQQKADGVWMQSAAERPPGWRPTTLPGGQTVYQSTHPPVGATEIWYHGVLVAIGIGTDPDVERAILNSIRYDAAARDTAVRGQCPAPQRGPIPMPDPIRITAPMSLDGGQAELMPEPASITPKASAADTWANFLHAWGGNVSFAPTVWHLYFGGYSDGTPAKIDPNGSTAPTVQGEPTWLVYGQGTPTTEGPCGPTFLTTYNADTGQSSGTLSTSG